MEGNLVGELASFSLPSHVEKLSMNKNGQSAVELASWSFHAAPAGPKRVPLQMFGTDIWSISASGVADQTYVDLNREDNNSRVLSIMLVGATSSGIQEGGIVIDSVNNSPPTIISASSNFTTTDEPGKLVVVNTGSGTTRIRNRLGVPVDITVFTIGQ